MMRTAVLFEPEELLFDTLALRSRVLHDALTEAGVDVDPKDVRQAHAGVPALVALTALPCDERLDDTGTELALRRAADLFHAAISTGLPSFDPQAAHAIAMLARAFPVGVVTRCDRVDAQFMLEQAGLEHCVSVIRSISSTMAGQQPAVWSDARAALRAERALALVPAGLRAGARAAGLETPYCDGVVPWHVLANADVLSVNSYFDIVPAE
jgi:phosphoglycolate phosphatase-like HAD superfamily hydrolase